MADLTPKDFPVLLNNKGDYVNVLKLKLVLRLNVVYGSRLCIFHGFIRNNKFNVIKFFRL